MVSDLSRVDEIELVEEAAGPDYPTGMDRREQAAQRARDAEADSIVDAEGWPVWPEDDTPAGGFQVECVVCSALVWSATASRDVACPSCEKGWPTA